MALRPDRLQALREQRGLSQRELARLCGLSFTQIHKYENNQTDPTSVSLTLMAEHLGVSTDYLLGLTDDPRGHVGDDTLDKDEQSLLNTYRREGWPGVASLSVDKWRQQT